MKRAICFFTALLILSFSVFAPVSSASYSAGPYHYYLPGFASGNGVWTGLALSNNGNQASELVVHVYGNDGSYLTGTEKNLPAGGQTSFPLVTEAGSAGWIYVNSHQPLNGLAFFSTHSDPLLMADIPFVSELMPELEVSHIAQNETWGTTIFLCNPQDQDVTITLRYITKDGTVAQTKNYTLPSKGGLSCSLASAFTVGNGLEGKVTISASAGIAAFALYSNTKNGGSYYAGINAVKSRRAYGVDPGSIDSINIASGKWSGTGLNFTVTEDKRIQNLVYTYQGESDCYDCKFTIGNIPTISNTASLHSKDGFVFDAVFSDKHTMSANVTVSNASRCLMTNEMILAEKDPGYILTSLSLDLSPRGLTFDGEFLWCTCTDSNYNNNIIYKLDTTTGNIIASFHAPGYNARGTRSLGLTFDGEFFWLADYCCVPYKIYKLDVVGNIITSFYTGHNVRGLAFDGEFLWIADPGTHEIFKLDATGNVLTSFHAPGYTPWGLAFDGESFWCVDSIDNKIYKSDASGNVLASFSSPGLKPRGLAFDGEFLWCADLNNKIYKLYIR